MPNFAYVEAHPHCPNCGATQTDLISFQWGYLPGYAPRAGQIYQVGDPIRWRLCRGEVLDWTFFYGAGDDDSCNVGSPAVADLYALDLQQQWMAGNCSTCGEPMGGAVVEIRNGAIVRAAILAAGTLAVESPSGLIRIDADESLTPIAEEVMSTRNDCGAPAFWTQPRDESTENLL